MSSVILVKALHLSDSDEPLYALAMLQEDGGYLPFDPFREGKEGEIPLYPYEVACARLTQIATQDPRVAVLEPVYEAFRGLEAKRRAANLDS